MQNLIGNFTNAANSPAILCKSHRLNLNDLKNISSTFSSLVSDKINKKDYVGLYLDNSSEFVISVLALWELGAVPVPLNILAQTDELKKLVSFAGIKSIITVKRNNDLSQAIKTVNWIELDTNFYKNYSLDKTEKKIQNPFYSLGVDDEAVVIFTSGSSGDPKGVVHTFHSLLSSIKNSTEVLNQTTDDRWLASLPFYHIGGFQIICRALYSGAGIIIPRSIQAKHLAEAITEFKPSHASFVSTQLKRLLDSNVKPNKELRCSLIGGGFIDKELLLRAKEHGWHPIKVYGSSETASFVCALKENVVESKGDSAGKPIGSNLIKIIDEDGFESGLKNQGEILIISESLFHYYLNNETETKNRLKQKNYLSGDIGYLDDEGYLYVTGRKNDIIVTGGKNVDPLEVENAILKYPGINQASVFPMDDTEWGEIVCAAIVASVKIYTSDLINFLKKELSSYKVPKKIFVEDSLPRNALGKVERIKLKRKYYQ